MTATGRLLEMKLDSSRIYPSSKTEVLPFDTPNDIPPHSKRRMYARSKRVGSVYQPSRTLSSSRKLFGQTLTPFSVYAQSGTMCQTWHSASERTVSQLSGPALTSSKA